MIEKLSLVVALAALALPWGQRAGSDPDARPLRRPPEGWDFGTMPQDERNADWS